MKASLRLHDIRLMMHVGHLDEERATSQPMRIDVDILFSAPPKACDTDELGDSVCYDSLISLIRQYCENNSFKLLEHLSKRLHALVLSQFSENDKVFIRVVKLNPPIDVLHGGAACGYGDLIQC